MEVEEQKSNWENECFIFFPVCCLPLIVLQYLLFRYYFFGKDTYDQFRI